MTILSHRDAADPGNLRRDRLFRQHTALAGLGAPHLARARVIGAKRAQPYQPRRFANISGLDHLHLHRQLGIATQGGVHRRQDVHPTRFMGIRLRSETDMVILSFRRTHRPTSA
jgi:hypothetical protein